MKATHALLLFACWTTLAFRHGSACAQNMKQIADPDFDAKVARPAFTETHPRLLFDEAHHNRHTSTGRFKPFADLMKNDGFEVVPNKTLFTKDSLAECRLLVIANAAASTENSTASAFSEDECDAVSNWVHRGGSLLLIADHAPFGSAARTLAERFGVDMRGGYTMDSDHCYRAAYWQLVFSRQNKLLADHAITQGRNKQEFISKVMTFGGQSLKGPKESTAFLKLAETAVDQPAFRSNKKTSAAGRAQGIAMEFGKGRVVVLGEAAMLSAQVLWIRGIGTQSPMGMNVPGIDNRQLTLNIVHWLARALN